MKLSGAWIDAPATQAVLSVLAKAGHRALFVGGSVRNAVLGAPVADIDIATDARPERVMALAGAAGIKAVPTGVDHGTVTLVSGGIPHEVTTFRRDVETDGRRAIVAFSDRVEEDAARRDFTMNALYAEADGTLVDPLGGLADARARRVRFIGAPQDRIREDYLRILRFFRFHAWYGDPAAGLEAEGLAACAELAEGLGRLARERVGHEMKRLLAAPDPAPSVAAMAQTGILPRVLPGADPRALAPLVHLEAAEGVAADPLRRLAALGGADPAVRLRLSRKEARRLEALRQALGAEAAPGELAWRHGYAFGLDVALLRAALAGQPLADDLRPRLKAAAVARFPVKPADLMPGYQGPALGRRLAELERRWVASGFTLTRAALLAGPDDD